MKELSRSEMTNIDGGFAPLTLPGVPPPPSLPPPTTFPTWPSATNPYDAGNGVNYAY